jgi:hypothetical protein
LTAAAPYFFVARLLSRFFALRRAAINRRVATHAKIFYGV